jgi:hypothetical protein
LEQQVFETFMARRDQLIDQLEANEISKAEYIEENYKQFVEGVQAPSIHIKTVEEGIVAYHYYNTKAKKMMIEGNELYYRDPYQAKKYHDGAHDQYVKKDAVTLAVIELMNYKGMEAYFVNLQSEDLNSHLYEIVLLDYHRVIFHSKDKRLLNRLKKNHVFSDELRPSKIDDYVNTKYCE